MKNTGHGKCASKYRNQQFKKLFFLFKDSLKDNFVFKETNSVLYRLCRNKVCEQDSTKDGGRSEIYR